MNDGKLFTDRRVSEHPEAGNPNQRVRFHPLCGETHDRRLPCPHQVSGRDLCHCGRPCNQHPIGNGWPCVDFRRAVRA